MLWSAVVVGGMRVMPIYVWPNMAAVSWPKSCSCLTGFFFSCFVSDRYKSVVLPQAKRDDVSNPGRHSFHYNYDVMDSNLQFFLVFSGFCKSA